MILFGNSPNLKERVGESFVAVLFNLGDRSFDPAFIGIEPASISDIQLLRYPREQEEQARRCQHVCQAQDVVTAANARLFSNDTDYGFNSE
jgi:hypothetical protein